MNKQSHTMALALMAGTGMAAMAPPRRLQQPEPEITLSLEEAAFNPGAFDVSRPKADKAKAKRRDAKAKARKAARQARRDGRR